MSYGLTKNPPKSRTRLPSNVMVELCHLNFDKWAACEVPHGFTVYTYVWGDYQHLGATPKHSYAFLADYAVNLVTNGVRGVYRCGFGELFGTEGPGYYVFNNKLEKPEADVESLVREYCARAYGSAASAMRRFHDTLDHRFRFLDRGLSGAWRNNGSENGVVKPLREVDPVSMFDLLAYVYTSDTIRKLDDALARAEGTKGLTAKQKTRLMVVRREYDYARSMGRLSAFYAAYGLNPSHEAFGRMADEIEHRNALVAEIVKGQSYVPRLPEWPELRFFGSYSAYAMKWNVRWATGAPLCWDVASLRARGVLPGAKTEKLKVKGVDTAPTGLDFEKGVWASAPWTPMVGCQLQDEKVKARFKILAGPKALHVAVETDLDDGVPIKPTGRDWRLWIQDTLELMIDPTGSRDRYFHFIWNPVEDSFYDAAYGLVTDTLDPKFKKEDRDWNVDFSYETTRGNGVWRTVANVPYASLQTVRPTAGEKWAFNIGRVAKQKGESDHLLIWNPNLARPALGDADALGILEFE